MDTFVSIAIAIAAIDTPSSRGDFARQATGGRWWGGPPSPLKKSTMRHMVPPTTPTAGAGVGPPTVLKLTDMRTRPRPLLCTQQQIQFYAGHQTAPISPKFLLASGIVSGPFLAVVHRHGVWRWALCALRTPLSQAERARHCAVRKAAIMSSTLVCTTACAAVRCRQFCPPARDSS